LDHVEQVAKEIKDKKIKLRLTLKENLDKDDENIVSKQVQNFMEIEADDFKDLTELVNTKRKNKFDKNK